MQGSTGYTLGFAASVCVFCSIFVAGAAVALKDRQDANAVLDRQKKVLSVAGLDCVGDMEPDAITEAFASLVQPVLVDTTTWEPVDVADVESIADIDAYDPRKAARDPAINIQVEETDESLRAKVSRLPPYEVVYYVSPLANPCESSEGLVSDATLLEQLIVPMQGPGLWSTLYGYVSVQTADFNTLNGLIFYEHAETPGLGGEVDNPRWKAKWVGTELRSSVDDNDVELRVVKGAADVGDTHGVDGLSGATITSNGVSYALAYWLGPDAFDVDVLRDIAEEVSNISQEGS